MVPNQTPLTEKSMRFCQSPTSGNIFGAAFSPCADKAVAFPQHVNLISFKINYLKLRLKEVRERETGVFRAHKGLSDQEGMHPVVAHCFYVLD